MNTPIMVTLDRDAMSGYLLNVLGTDQIHDFCGGRLTKATPLIRNSSQISHVITNFNKDEDNLIFNEPSTKKQRTKGGNSDIHDLTDYEVIEQQCLELIHIFVNTIFDNSGLNVYSKLSGGQNTPIKPQKLSNDKIEELTKSPTSVTFIEEQLTNSYTNTELDSVKKNLLGSFDEDLIYYDNMTKWGSNVKSKIVSFTRNPQINYSLNYICIDDVINIFNLYLIKLNGLMTGFDVEQFEYFITLYVESMKYFISPPLTYCYDNIQKGGQYNPNKSLTSTIKIIIKEMAFTFCNISDNCDDWEKSRNWKCFEIGLLKNNTSEVESTSSNWVRNQIFKQPPNQTNINNRFNFIKPLTGLFKEQTLNCKLTGKTYKKHIIINSANLNENLKPLILNNYPSFIDSQSSGGKEEDLLEKMEVYNCGFRNPSNNYYYKINMDSSFNTHTIDIKCDNKNYHFTQTYSDFKIYNKKNQQSSSATKWKDVTLCVALINALESMSYILKEKNINELSMLIHSIKQKKPQTVKNVNNQKKKLNIIELFYMFSLFKGLGDISQEMTSVIKYGGGNKNTISPKDNYEAFDTSGNALRFFLARDQLSANRFILTLNYGLEYGLKTRNDNNINSKAYGGYLNVSNCNPKDIYLVEANQPLLKTTTGGNKKHSRKYKNSKRKRKNHTKNTRNKHNKTYKLYKKNT